MTLRAAIHSKAPSRTNEGKLAATIAASLAPEVEVRKDCQGLKLFSCLWRSDVLIVHSPLLFSVLAIILAKLLRRPVIAFVWDVYPVTINGRRYDRRLRRRLADSVERFAIWASDHLIVQTDDFAMSPLLARAKTLPFWYAPPAATPSLPEDTGGPPPLRFAFAGQINDTRGLADTLRSLDKRLTRAAILNIYSRDPFTAPDGLTHVEVRHAGFLSADNLATALTQNDIGIVSLNPGFGGPAFPSKSLDYLGAGLPIAYFGPPLPHFSALLAASQSGITASASTQADFDQLAASRIGYPEIAETLFGLVRADPNQLKAHVIDVLGYRADTPS